MQLRKKIGFGVGAVLLLLLIVYGFKPVPVWVDVAEVKRGALQVTIEEEGRTRVIDRYVVSAPVAGYVRRLGLDVGDSVDQGQTLMKLEALPSAALDPRSQAEAEARVQAAKASFDVAREQAAASQAEAELAQLEYDRIVKLCKVQCASKEQEDLALTRVRRTQAIEQSAQFAVDVALHQLEGAKTALTFTGATTGDQKLNISSPIAGSVLKVLRESEGVVGAGEPLLEVGHPQQLEVEVDVLSADAVKIAPGTNVLFERWGGDESLQGKVRNVEPVGFTKVSALGVEEQRVLVISDLVSDPKQWQRLGDGYRVEARFILWQSQDVLIVPASSLFRSGDGWAVFVVEGGVARRVEVEVGQRNGLKAQVISGLNEADVVIAHPGEGVADGVGVAVR